MKKALLFSIITIIQLQVVAQQYLLPFEKDGKFGLMNESGKTVLQPKFDYIEWLSDKYFKATSRIQLNDTVEIEPRRFYIRNEEIKLSSLIYNGKEILKDEPFEDYYLLPGKFILAKTDKRKRSFTKEQLKKYQGRERFSSIFNLNGKNLFPENFKRINVVDTGGLSIKNSKSSKYVLLVSEDFDNKQSVFVYDADKQSISEWLLKNVSKLKADREDYYPRMPFIKFTYTDENYEMQSAIIDRSGGKFVFKKLPSPSEKSASGRRGTQQVEEVTLSREGMYSDNVAVPTEREIRSETPVKRKFIPYYQKINDTLFYLSDYDKKEKVDTTAGQLIYQSPDKYITQSKIIYKQNGKFGFHKDNKYLPAEYDSMAYFGTYFLVGKKQNDKIKFGIIDNADSLKVPIVYDSIDGFIGLMVSYSGHRSNLDSFQIINEADRYSYGSKPKSPYTKSLSYPIIVYQNGKAGVLSWDGDFLLPIEYEGIWKNGFNFMRPKVSEFFIIKKDGKYGAAELKYDSKKNPKNWFETILPPTQNYIPLFRYNDYYGIKGLKVFGLYSPNIKLKGFAVAP